MATGMSKRKTPEADHPTYAEMVGEAIIQLKQRQGSSRGAIANYMKAHNDFGTISAKVVSLHFC